VLVPLVHPIRSKSKTYQNSLAHIFHTLSQLHTFAVSFDWFTGLSASFVVSQSDYFGFGFGFGFTTLN